MVAAATYSKCEAANAMLQDMLVCKNCDQSKLLLFTCMQRWLLQRLTVYVKQPMLWFKDMLVC